MSVGLNYKSKRTRSTHVSILSSAILVIKPLLGKLRFPYQIQQQIPGIM